MLFHFQGFLQVDFEEFHSSSDFTKKNCHYFDHDHNFLFLNTINQFALLTHSLSKYKMY